MANELPAPDEDSTDKADKKPKRRKPLSLKDNAFLVSFVVAVIFLAALMVLVLSYYFENVPIWLTASAGAIVALGILVAVAGVYPLTYIAYLGFREKPQKEQLKDDFRLLGLVREEDLDETVQILYQTVYHSLQYVVFIALIMITTILVLGAFLVSQGALDFGQNRANIIGSDQAKLVFFAFLGAYFFSINELVRRYNTFDLLPQVYSSILVRMVSAVLIVYVGATLILGPYSQIEAIDDRARAQEGYQLAADMRLAAARIMGVTTREQPGSTPSADTPAATATPAAAANGEISQTLALAIFAKADELETAAALLAARTQSSSDGGTGWPAVGLLLAFIIGAFPKYGIQWFASIVTKAVSGFRLDPQSQRPLTNILGISTWHEARLIEMGLDDAQNLATVDMRRLLLTTQFDTQEIVNWIDQAILYVKVSDRIDTFRRVGITSFYEMRAMIGRKAVKELALAKAVKEGAATQGRVEGGTTPEEALKNSQEAWNRLLIVLGFGDEMDLERLADYSNYPNYAHIYQYYYNTEMVVRQRALEGRNLLIGDQNTLAKSIVIIGSNPLAQVDVDYWQNELERSQLLVSLSPQNAEPHLRLGYAYYRLAQRDLASASFKEAIGITPTLEDAYVGLGAVELDAGASVELEAAAKAKEAADAEAKAKIMAEAKVKAANHYLEAVRMFTNALSFNATLPEVYNNRALANMKLGYLDQALKDLNRALDISDDLHAAYLNRGSVYLAYTAFEEDADTAFQQADRDLQIAYILGNRSHTLWVYWGTALIGLRKFEEAVQKFSQAVLQNVDLARAYDRRGYAYMQLGPRYYSQARKDMLKAVEIDATLATPHANLGLLAAYEGNDDLAVEPYTTALELDPNLTTTRYNRAEAYMRLLKFDKAKEDLRIVVRDAPEGSEDFVLAMEGLRRVWRQTPCSPPPGGGGADTHDAGASGGESASQNSGETQTNSSDGETAENGAQTDSSAQNAEAGSTQAQNKNSGG